MLVSTHFFRKGMLGRRERKRPRIEERGWEERERPKVKGQVEAGKIKPA